jgi:hypothetical protein
MPFFSKDERENVKRFLDDVMDDKSLASEFKKAKARKDGVCSDYTDAMLGQYIGIIKEIQADRAQRAENVKSATPGPGLEQLKKKFLGPNHK